MSLSRWWMLPSARTSSTACRLSTSNLVTDVVDPLLRDTHFTYDSNGDVLSVTQLFGTTNANTYSYTYEPVYQRIASITDPMGHVTTFSYNDAAQTEAVTDPLGRQTLITFFRGLVASVTDPLGRTSYFDYVDGLPSAYTDPLGDNSTASYDLAGNLVASTDALENTTTYTYDAATATY